jgi:hypothetical protein
MSEGDYKAMTRSGVAASTHAEQKLASRAVIALGAGACVMRGDAVLSWHPATTRTMQLEVRKLLNVAPEGAGMPVPVRPPTGKTFGASGDARRVGGYRFLERQDPPVPVPVPAVPAVALTPSSAGPRDAPQRANRLPCVGRTAKDTEPCPNAGRPHATRPELHMKCATHRGRVYAVDSKRRIQAREQAPDPESAEVAAEPVVDRDIMPAKETPNPPEYMSPEQAIGDRDVKPENVIGAAVDAATDRPEVRGLRATIDGAVEATYRALGLPPEPRPVLSFRGVRVEPMMSADAAIRLVVLEVLRAAAIVAPTPRVQAAILAFERLHHAVVAFGGVAQLEAIASAADQCATAIAGPAR